MIDEKKIKPFTPPLPYQDTTRPTAPVVNYMSTPKIYGLIRLLCRKTKGPYLEIGSYRGMGLLAAAYDKNIKVVGIDNFTGVGYLSSNEKILRKQIASYQNIKFIKADYKAALNDLIKSAKNHFGVIFVDGPHDYQGTYTQLALSCKMLQSGGFVIVDDTNWRETHRAASEYFEKNKRFELVFEKKTVRRDDPEWWNGLQVWQREKA